MTPAIADSLSAQYFSNRIVQNKQENKGSNYGQNSRR
jgi:hypothetical protein